MRTELERRLKNGMCAYCGKPASDRQSLTKEHVVPLARGGRRKDIRIIVPACALCNHGRGSREFVLFLLSRPVRLRFFLCYLDSLPPESLRQMDRRVFAELYTAMGLLGESLAPGECWRTRLRTLCRGRRLHRRRYAARRVVGAVEERFERAFRRRSYPAGPSCLLTASREEDPLGTTMRELRAALATLLSRLWQAPAEQVLEELTAERRRLRAAHRSRSRGDDGSADDSSRSLRSWKERKRTRKRQRVDPRRGRAVRSRAA